MNITKISLATVLFLCGTAQIHAQSVTVPQPQDQVPIYRVTVIGRSITAVNFGNRNIPTKIGFKGTVLQPDARGEANVENKRGATKIEAKFEKLPPPTKFGRQFLTYVLWAITPEGRPMNLGEIVLDDANKGKLHVTTEMQAFGLMVTAEPYYSVVQPSDVVVLENFVRSDTVGKVERIQARAELLPRGEYQINVTPGEPVSGGKKVPYDQYEAILALYQAQNAVQIAHSQGGDRYAPESMAKANQLLMQAQRELGQKMPKQVIMTARQAAQAAEDARLITAKRVDEEREATERRMAAEREERARLEAQAAADQARQDAEAAARERAEVRTRVVESTIPSSDTRSRFVQDVGMVLLARETPRGLAVNLLDDLFNPGSAILAPAGREKLSRLAGMLAAHPGLKVEVEGYSYPVGTQPQLFSQRAAAVRDFLMQQGIQAVSITARGFSMRPPAGASQTAHVEMLMSGDFIGGTGNQPASAAVR